ncbi:MAG: rRNA maturation RNase YbeY [Endomicrobiia bacterium]
MVINFFYKTKLKITTRYKLKNYIKKILSILFPNLKIRKKFVFNFVFVNNKEIKKINRKYLNKNYPTDILCFKYDKHSADFIISLEQVIKNAKIFKNDKKRELLLVIIHGFLHFKGMQDATSKEKERMDLLSEKILYKLIGI